MPYNDWTQNKFNKSITKINANFIIESWQFINQIYPISILLLLSVSIRCVHEVTWYVTVTRTTGVSSSPCLTTNFSIWCFLSSKLAGTGVSRKNLSASAICKQNWPPIWELFPVILFWVSWHTKLDANVTVVHGGDSVVCVLK